MTPVIVYVDDEPLLCKAFRLLFKHDAVEVVTFTAPESAVDFIRSRDVSVVVCDYRMPGLTGLEVLERIAKDVPFYIVTGDLGITRIASLRPGVTGVLAKPFAPSQLLELVRGHLAG